MNIPVLDLHQDLLPHIRERSVFANQWQTSFQLIEASTITTTFATAFPSPSDDNFLDPANNKLIEADLRAYKTYCAEHDDWNIITSLTSLDFEGAGQKKSLILHVEGLNSFTLNDFGMLERWYELGLRSLGIVWNLTNSLGGGTHDATAGLTALGAEVIRWSQSNGIVVDLAHMNEQTFWDTARVTQKPLFVSHANSAAVTPHVRNLSDKQLREVAQTGGVVGVTFIGQTISENLPSIEKLADHIDHMREVMGANHISLGSDLGGVVSGLVAGINDVRDIPNLWNVLRQRGYSEAMLHGIAYGNAQRVLRAS